MCHSIRNWVNFIIFNFHAIQFVNYGDLTRCFSAFFPVLCQFKAIFFVLGVVQSYVALKEGNFVTKKIKIRKLRYVIYGRDFCAFLAQTCDNFPIFSGFFFSG